MNESLKDAMSRAADAVGTAEPDLAAIERRGFRRRRRRLGATGFVAVLAAVAVAVPLYELSGMGASRQPVSATTNPSNGAIWVRVGGGDGPSFVYEVDPTTGTALPLFNDQQRGSDGLPGE